MKPTCGAKTRTGAPCKSRVLHRKGKCKNHGGLSTGPRTEDGKRRSRNGAAKGRMIQRLRREKANKAGKGKTDGENCAPAHALPSARARASWSSACDLLALKE